MNEPSPLEVIFFTALEKGSPQECAAYLDLACAGDHDLRGASRKCWPLRRRQAAFWSNPPSA